MVGGVLLLTGVPGIGKTTVIRRVADRLQNRRIGGFYTEEIREDSDRRGFRLVGFDGSEGVIADVDFPTVPRVGKYGVDVEAIDEAADRLSLPPAAEIYLVDEIGKMECLSDPFVSALQALLAGPHPVVATIALRGTGFIEEVKRLKSVLIWEVTRANRDKLPERVLAWLAAKVQPKV
jgi:nucleoside-triphosphatase